MNKEVMRYPANIRALTRRFDFEIGCLIKSPCKECDNKQNVPDCVDNCILMDNIQSILATAVSCSKDP